MHSILSASGRESYKHRTDIKYGGNHQISRFIWTLQLYCKVNFDLNRYHLGKKLIRDPRQLEECIKSVKNGIYLFDVCQLTAVNRLDGSTHSTTSQATLEEDNQEWL